ncbi:hypothetical protein [Streptomyces cyaneofuscatus]|uniref:Uncharacterized protein n=1 Tax=Streptomyces cyaneofuscatus TaxID=66883 RepID=A0ABZ1EVX6_9ACTN|nr:hypothetical protein [Streptomyces cyaneofuscatus]WSB08289.1 hypothetical protein OG849_14000 [Streptomyces cyaneofuscatus]WSD48178.1 hypothetical protein OG857_21405 [Streptomyces cyaneofuscatus]WTA91551.1 hypothetical protein OG323_22380 [Streptomyces cyaneofuscatus]
MRNITVQSQSWNLDEEINSIEETEEAEETQDTAYSFSYARV